MGGSGLLRLPDIVEDQPEEFWFPAPHPVGILGGVISDLAPFAKVNLLRRLRRLLARLCADAEGSAPAGGALRRPLLRDRKLLCETEHH